MWILRPADRQKEAKACAENANAKISVSSLFPVNHACDKWKEHKEPFKLQNLSQNITNHRIFHNRLILQNFFDVRYIVTGSGNHDGVTRHHAVLSAWHDNLIVAVNTADQGIFTEL